MLPVPRRGAFALLCLAATAPLPLAHATGVVDVVSGTVAPSVGVTIDPSGAARPGGTARLVVRREQIPGGTQFTVSPVI